MRYSLVAKNKVLVRGRRILSTNIFSQYEQRDTTPEELILT